MPKHEYGFVQFVGMRDSFLNNIRRFWRSAARKSSELSKFLFPFISYIPGRWFFLLHPSRVSFVAPTRPITRTDSHFRFRVNRVYRCFDRRKNLGRLCTGEKVQRGGIGHTSYKSLCTSIVPRSRRPTTVLERFVKELVWSTKMFQ